MFITNLLLITYFDFQLIILTCFNLTHNSFPSDLLTSEGREAGTLLFLILIVGLCIVASAVLD